jgi:carbon monoxide dehydrogenase subunit G
MIETEQTVTIRESIENVWNFARDIRGWAELMPGMQECEVIDDDNSRWTLKVGVGGLVRTVRVQVRVDQWDGPQRVYFTYKLEGDPVQGGGSYYATPAGPRETQVQLNVRVEGSGPMAPMWEAMGRPLLPQLAKAFSGQLRDKIEAAAGDAPAVAPAKASGIVAWLRSVWSAIFGRREGKQA